eukprot:361455-Chlamydomonas_euryale.AAC.1
MQVLLRAGADVNYRAGEAELGVGALHEAVWHKRTAVARTLLAAGARTDAKVRRWGGGLELGGWTCAATDSAKTPLLNAAGRTGPDAVAHGGGARRARDGAPAAGRWRRPLRHQRPWPHAIRHGVAGARVQGRERAEGHGGCGQLQLEATWVKMRRSGRAMTT